MTSQEIIESIQNWDNIRQDSEQLIRYLDQGNCYTYDFPAYAQTSDFLHAYPGICNEKLFFFMIPSAYDKEEYHEIIDQYTIPCLVQNAVNNSNDRLTTEQAKARIQAWQNNYQAWVPGQVESVYGIFEAFTIPAQDFEVENVIVTLGLKINTSLSSGFEADLIITNDDGEQVVYDDFVQPVPPYGVDAIAQQNFSLLPVSSS